MKRRAVPFLVIPVALGCLAPSALAANQAVTVADNSFVPSRVAVAPGQTVTWTASGGNPHNVAFEDGLLIDPVPAIPAPWSTSRTFAGAGTYRYYCQIHGSPNGGGMSGTVYVNAAGNVPPIAFFAATPATGQPGQPVSFDASGSSDPDGTIARYEWDLDGNGSFETDTGSAPTTSRSYAIAGTSPVTLRITDNAGASSELTISLRVNAPPTASFAVAPNPARAGVPVTFNGSSSTDADGVIAKYEWDLDGNGSFETNRGSDATASRPYAAPGTFNVRLRVTDGNGSTAETSRSLQITSIPPTPLLSGGGGLTGTAPLLPPSFASSKRTIKVGKSGRFSYSLEAQAGLSGTIGLRSASKVRMTARRRISLGTKSFSVPDNGIVKVSWKVSRKGMKALKLNRSIRFRATATVRNTAGKTASGSTTLTLRKPAG